MERSGNPLAELRQETRTVVTDRGKGVETTTSRSEVILPGLENNT